MVSSMRTIALTQRYGVVHAGLSAVSVAESGEEAVSMLRTSPIGTYQLVLTVLPLTGLVAVFCSKAIRSNRLKRL